MTDAAFVVDTARRKAAGPAVFFGLLSGYAVGDLIVTGQAAAILILLFSVPLACWLGRTAIEGRTVLVIDAEGLTFVQRGFSVVWRDIRAVRIQGKQWFLNVDRDLIVILDPRLFREPSPGASRRQIDVPLRWTRPSLDAIAAAVEARSDLTVDRLPAAERRR